VASDGAAGEGIASLMRLDRQRYELHLAVFREELHPRLHGKFAKKGLDEGLTKPTKSLVTNKRQTSLIIGDKIAPLKHVEHKKINAHLRARGAEGQPEPRRLKAIKSPFDAHANIWADVGPGTVNKQYKLGDVEHDIAGIDQVMAHHTLKKDVTTLRAVPSADIEHLSVGDQWTEHGYVSTSKTVEGSRHFTGSFSTFKGGKDRAYLKITAPKGTHAYDYGPKDKDHELVLDRGMTYVVTGEERDPQGHRVLLVKVLSEHSHKHEYAT
jgi:hypothetical protein